MEIDCALPVSEISDERNARLLLLSSHASPPSSKQSFHAASVNFTASIVFLLFSTPVLPSCWTSMPPHIQTIGYAHALGSLRLCPSAWPKGLPFAFMARPTLRKSAHGFGYARPASLDQSSRYLTAPERMKE